MDLVGRTFISEQELPGGNSPAGPVMSRWTITFGTGDYSWQYSDMAERGQLECEHGELRGIGPGHASRSGRYDAAARRLVWEGQLYAAAPRAVTAPSSQPAPQPRPTPQPPPAPPAPPADPGSPRVPALATSEQEARGCRTAEDCVTTCRVDGDCCGTVCGCDSALNRDFLPRLEAHLAKVCSRSISCPPVGCAMRGPFFPACVNGLCEARTFGKGGF